MGCLAGIVPRCTAEGGSGLADFGFKAFEVAYLWVCVCVTVYVQEGTGRQDRLLAEGF